MPARIVVSLTPTSPNALPPPQTGPAVNAAVLAAIRDGLSPELSAALHDGPPPRPFAVTPLLDEHQQAPSRTSRHVRFEIGVLLDHLVGPVLACLATHNTWRFGTTGYTASDVTLAAAETYPDLLAAAPPATSWELTMITPVSFATGRGDGARRQHVLPEPTRVFATLAARWRTWSPETPLPVTIDSAIIDHLEIVDLRLRTIEYLVKTGTPPRRGCVGYVRYRLADPAGVTPETRGGIEALARFARYAGIGDRTASGMGYIADAARPRTHRGGAPRQTAAAPSR